MQISRLSVWAAGAFMIATVFMIGAEIVMRKLGSGLVSGASEVGGYMLAICSVWAFSYTLLQRSNIRFDVLYVRCGPRMRAWMDLRRPAGLGDLHLHRDLSRVRRACDEHQLRHPLQLQLAVPSGFRNQSGSPGWHSCAGRSLILARARMHRPAAAGPRDRGTPRRNSHGRRRGQARDRRDPGSRLEQDR